MNKPPIPRWLVFSVVLAFCTLAWLAVLATAVTVFQFVF